MKINYLPATLQVQMIDEKGNVALYDAYYTTSSLDKWRLQAVFYKSTGKWRNVHRMNNQFMVAGFQREYYHSTMEYMLETEANCPVCHGEGVQEFLNGEAVYTCYLCEGKGHAKFEALRNYTNIVKEREMQALG